MSKANHKNVAVWSTRSMLVSDQLVNHASLYCHHVSLDRERSRDPVSPGESERVTVAVSLARFRTQPSDSGEALRYKRRGGLSNSVNYREAASIPPMSTMPRYYRSSAPLRTLLGLALVAINRIYDLIGHVRATLQ